MPSLMSRREAISLLAITVGGAVLVPRSAFAQQGAALIDGSGVCTIIPEVTEGPFYFDPELLRADITEGRPGLPVRLKLQVVDEACVPIAGARVDVWHCDALGAYSGYDNKTPRETFMRGTQFADDAGVAEFQTVYPGWYRGRTTHIHFKVFLDETNVLTGQIFFPDEVSDKVYTTLAPYAERGAERETLNGNDGIARQAGAASVAKVEALAEEYLVALVVGVEAPGQFGGMSFPATNG